MFSLSAPLWVSVAHSLDTAGNAGEQVTGDVITTTVPEDVTEPRGKVDPADLKDEENGSYSASDDDKYPAPTEEEKKTLRR